MKNKKGFTLIELLAVIVILAIIALIATPIILGIINNASLQSKERTSELIGDAVVNAYTSYALKNPAANSSSYCEYMKTEFTMDNASVKSCESDIAIVKSGNDEYQVKYENGKAYVTLEGLEKVVEVVLTSTIEPIVQATPESCFEYRDNGDNTVTIKRYTCAIEVPEWDWEAEKYIYTYVENPIFDVVIPDTLDGKSVTSIGSDAFWGSQLTSITIPSSVTSIGEYAFVDNELTNIIINDYSNLEIDDGAFANSLNRSNNLSNETKQNILNINSRAFYYDIGQ